ncbi:hypothetical protein GJAV_G00032880 [Gymnothorax javanicus]|nr:hypothetical protein GJAV_G00032880 [Gymnothorax javanicus]
MWLRLSRTQGTSAVMWWCSSRLALVCLALLLLQGHLSSARRGRGGSRGRFSSKRSFRGKYDSSFKPYQGYRFRSSYHRPYVGGGYFGNPGKPDWSSFESSVVSQPKPDPFDDEIAKICRELLGMPSTPTRSTIRGDEGGVSGRTGAGSDDHDAHGSSADSRTTPEPRTDGSQPSPTTAKPILTTEGNKMDTDFDKVMKDVNEWVSELRRTSMTPLCRDLFRLRPDYYRA